MCVAFQSLISHNIVRELEIGDYERAEALGIHYGHQALLPFVITEILLTIDNVRYRS